MEKGNEEPPKCWFVCKLCNRAFTKRIQLLQHKKRNHWNEYFAETGGSLKDENSNKDSGGSNDVSGDPTVAISNMEGTDRQESSQSSATILVTNSRRISVTEEIRTMVMTPAKSVIAKPQAIVSPAMCTSQFTAAATTSSGTAGHFKKVPRTVVKDEDIGTEELRRQVDVFNCPSCDHQFSTLRTWFSHIMAAHGNQWESSNTELSNRLPHVEKFQAKPSPSAQKPAPSKSKQSSRPSGELEQHSEDKSPTVSRKASCIPRASPAADSIVHLGPRSLKTHSNLRIQCQKCPKNFSNRILHREHMNVHIGRRPHRCPFCPMRFFSSSTNYRHIKELHADRLRSNKTASSKAASEKQDVQGKQQRSDLFKSQKNKRNREEPDQPEIRIETNRFSIANNESCHSRPDEPYKCNICRQVFKRLEILKTHLRTTHKIQGREAMKKCGAVLLEESFEDETESCIISARRKKRISGPVPALISLDVKSAVSTEESPLSGMKSNFLTKPSIRTNLKPKNRNTDQAIDNSINRSLTRTRGGYKCFLCKKYFSHRIAMLRHFSEEHPSIFERKEQDSDVQNSPCAKIQYNHPKAQQGDLPEVSKERSQAGRDQAEPESPESFLNLQNRSRERKRRLRNRKVEYKCNYCSKYFPTGYITTHERCHTGERPFKCTMCPNAFARRDTLKNHQSSHYKISKVRDRYVCPDSCGYTADFKRPIFRHMERCHRIPYPKIGKVIQKRQSSSAAVGFGTESKLSVCPKNNAPTSQYKIGPETDEAGNSNRHITTTTVNEAARPALKSKGPSYQCMYCSKMQHSFVRLQEHMSMHTGQKLYECSLCDESFRYGVIFNKHKKTAHGDSAACVPRNPIRATNYISQSCDAEGYSEPDGEGNGNSVVVAPPIKIPSSNSSSIPRRSAETVKTLKKIQACMLCDALTGHLKIHLTTTHNITKEKAEKLAMSVSSSR